MAGELVDVVVAQVVREAHHAAELGVRRVQYPAVHHPAAGRARGNDVAAVTAVAEAAAASTGEAFRERAASAAGERGT